MISFGELTREPPGDCRGRSEGYTKEKEKRSGRSGPTLALPEQESRARARLITDGKIQNILDTLDIVCTVAWARFARAKRAAYRPGLTARCSSLLAWVRSCPERLEVLLAVRIPVRLGALVVRHPLGLILRGFMARACKVNTYVQTGRAQRA